MERRRKGKGKGEGGGRERGEEKKEGTCIVWSCGSAAKR